MKIEEYKFGKIIIDGKEYNKDLIIYGDTIITNWRRERGHVLTNKDMKSLWDKVGGYKGAIDILVVGTGIDRKMILSDEEGNNMLDIVKLYVSQTATDLAVEQFNELIEKGCNVAAAFHLTC